MKQRDYMVKGKGAEKYWMSCDF